MLSGGRSIASAVSLSPKLGTPGWETLVLRADDDANANSAVALDIVFGRDAAVLDILATMSASKWFASRADMQRSFPEALTVLSFELVPGQIIKVPDNLWRKVAGRGVLAFAGYASQGEHRIRLTLDTHGYLVQLGAQDFSAVGLKKQDKAHDFLSAFPSGSSDLGHGNDAPAPAGTHAPGGPRHHGSSEILIYQTSADTYRTVDYAQANLDADVERSPSGAAAQIGLRHQCRWHGTANGTDQSAIK